MAVTLGVFIGVIELMVLAVFFIRSNKDVPPALLGELNSLVPNCKQLDFPDGGYIIC
jgi:hypothetical protein